MRKLASFYQLKTSGTPPGFIFPKNKLDFNAIAL